MNDSAVENRVQVSRRRFLVTTGATLGADLTIPTVVPASALGKEKSVAPSNRIGIGMIGMGRQVLAYSLKPFVTAKDAQIAAICDVDSWRLAVTHERVATVYGRKWHNAEFHGACDRVRDFREILGRDDIDAVMISTPDHWHVPMAVAAAEAGKDICCEKPLSLSIADGRALVNAVDKHKPVFRTDSEFRSIKVFHRAAELIRNGRIGELHTISVGVPGGAASQPTLQQTEMPVPKELDYDLWLGPAPLVPYHEMRVHPPHDYQRPGWYNNQDYCDGYLVNWGHHLYDIVQWANDTERTGPVEVEGTGKFPPRDSLWNVLYQFEVRYRYANGVQMLVKSGPPSIRFEGDDGWIEVVYGRRNLTAEPASVLDSKIGPDEIRFPLKHEKRDFLDCVKSRAQTMEDAEVGHRATSIGLLGCIAIQVGQKLKWDPNAERFVDNDEANKLLARPPGRTPWNVV